MISGEAADRLAAALADRYAIERELGQGGMATVYLAQDRKLGRAVALKVLRPELAAALGSDRFLREIEIAAKLTHPHILALHDCGEADGLLYYTMPFVEGESLRDRLSREKQLPLEDALRITREVADALGYAHSHGLIHRDIKPENILFEAGHAVVSDFGIARAVSAAGSARLTETGLAVGTPQYMSPEQAAGSQDLDGRSDLYSLGCVLYEMLSGETPYGGPTPQAILAKKLSEPLPRISVVRDAVPAGIEAALNKALARTPADRWVTAADFATALAHPEADAQGHGRTDAQRGPKLRWWRHRAVHLAAAAATVVAMAAIAAVLVIRGLGPALDRTVVAVAPFESRIRDTSLAQLGEIAADWVVQSLQGTGAIKVVPTSAVAATGWAPGANPRVLAAATGAGTLIIGRATLQGDSVYLRADVVDGRSGALLHSVPPVAAGKRQPLGAVEELARRVVGATAEIVDPEAPYSSATVSRPRSYQAYQAYAEGDRFRRVGEWDRAREQFERAYALDTTFVRALLDAAVARMNTADLAGADSLLRVVERGRDWLTRVDQLDLEIDRADMAGDIPRQLAAARELCRLLPPRAAPLWYWGISAIAANHPAEAIHIFTEFMPDYSRPGAPWGLATAYHMLGRYQEELKAAQRGRRAQPSDFDVLNAELRALVAVGREEDVFGLLDKVRGMEPDPSVSGEFWGGFGAWQPYLAALEFRAHGHPQAYRRAIQQALELARAAPASDTVRFGPRNGLAMALYAAERWEEARAVYAALYRGDSTNVEFLGGLGVSEARLGHRAEAERLARRLAATNPPWSGGRSPYWRARIAAVLGDRDGAVTALREAIAQGISCALHVSTGTIEDCHLVIDFESLRGYAPFVELMRPKG